MTTGLDLALVLGWLADAVLCLLLISALVVGFRLNRRLDDLRAGRSEMAQLIRALMDATSRAESVIGRLKEEGGARQDELRTSVSSAQALREELTFIIQAGDALASRLEQSAQNAGRATSGQRNAPPSADAEPHAQAPSGDRRQAGRNEATTEARKPMPRAMEGMR